jgi:hypothetical protein
MNIENYYYKVNYKPSYINEIVEFLPHASWRWVPFMTVATNFQNSLGLQLTENDILLKSLKEKYWGSLKLYQFPSHTFYPWHKDAEIGCSLNLIMQDYRSITLFKSDTNRTDILQDIIELKYEKNVWYVFNSQLEHAVVNLDERDRILLTITFPKTVKYQDLLSYVKNNLNL